AYSESGASLISVGFSRGTICCVVSALLSSGSSFVIADVTVGDVATGVTVADDNAFTQCSSRKNGYVGRCMRRTGVAPNSRPQSESSPLQYDSANSQSASRHSCERDDTTLTSANRSFTRARLSSSTTNPFGTTPRYADGVRSPALSRSNC